EDRRPRPAGPRWSVPQRTWLSERPIARWAWRLALLERRLAQPLVEPDVAESRLAPGDQRPFTEFGPEVKRVRIGANFPGVLVRGEALTDQFVETELFGTGHFNDAVHWGPHGDFGNRLGDVLSRHRLKEHWWHPDRCADGGFIGNAFDELEELRGVNDR